MITPIYAALLGLLFVMLSLRIIQFRRSVKVSIGHGNIAYLQRLIRVHGNFSEYVPLILLLIYFLELQLKQSWFVHLLCGLLLLGRCVHAYGVSQTYENIRLRVLGMALTFSVLIGACAGLLGVSIVSALS